MSRSIHYHSAFQRLAISGLGLVLFVLTACVSDPLRENSKVNLPGWSPTRFVFDGTPTGKDVFASTGIVVQGNQDKKFILLHNTVVMYLVALPYSEQWVFDIEKGYLKGNAGLINFDVQIGRGSETSDEHLKKLKDYLLSANKPIPIPSDTAELVAYGSRTVLRSEIEGGKVSPMFKGMKHINFYSVRKRGESLFKLHLSVVVPPGGPSIVEEDFLWYVAEGFVVLDGT
jgi:hypothetical protein